MKTKGIIRLISMITVLLFSFTLIQIPVGSASEPISGTETSIPTMPVMEPVQTEVEPVIPQDPTAAFSNGDPLSTPESVQEIVPEETEPPISFPPEQPISPVDPEPIIEPIGDPYVRLVEALVRNDLINTFGFNREMLDEAIRNGLIKINVNLETLHAEVIIDPSVKLPEGALNLFDLLGSNRLPNSIQFRLGKTESEASLMPCAALNVINCPPPPSPTYYLASGTLNIGDKFIQLNYIKETFPGRPEENRLHSVKIYDGNPNIVCITTPCPTGELIKEISYVYIYHFAGEEIGLVLTANVHYLDQSQGMVTSRKVEFRRMEDGRNHIHHVVDYDQEGNVIAKSEFNYLSTELPCPQTGVCGYQVTLYEITRTDAAGNLLSKITITGELVTAIFPPPAPTYEATVVLLDGRQTQVTFKTIEELLSQVLKLENNNFLSHAFDEAFELLNKLMSGQTIQIQDAQKMRDIQSLLKKAVEGLPDNERSVWTAKFNDYLNKSDHVLATKALKVVLADGREIIVRNTTELFASIIRRYRMMEQTGEINLDRFAGIDPEDLVELETFADYIAGRQIGTSLNIPLFDLYSPLGNLTLIDRIVHKYPFSQTEGPVEVAHQDLLRYIDGTKPVFDRAIAVANEVFAAHQIQIPQSPITLERLSNVLGQMASLNQALVEGLLHELSLYEGEVVFKNLLINDITNTIMYGGNGTQLYARIWNDLNNALNLTDVIYEVNGKQVSVSRAELDDFSNRLPWNSANLFRYPGVKSDVDPAFLTTLISQDFYSRLAYVNLNSLWDSINPLNQNSENVFFSYPARRFQLLEAFLKTWGTEVIRENGTVDFDKLRFRLLISYELEQALGRAEEYLAGKISEMEAYAQKTTFTSEDYDAMKNILKAAQEELSKRFQPLLQNVIYDTTNEVTSRVNLRYQNLVQAFSSVLNTVSVTVTLADGTNLVFKPGEIRREVLDKILAATAFRAYSGAFDKSAYLRLHGIDEAMLSGLLTPSQLWQLKQFNFYNYYSTWQEPYLADEEILFSLIPQIVGKAERTDIDSLVSFLTEGIALPVALDESLEATIKEIAQGLTQDARNAIANLTVQTADDLLVLRDILKKLNLDLRDRLTPYITTLSESEKSQVEYWVNYDWRNPNNLSRVLQLFDTKIANLEFLDVNGVRVPVRQILNIAGFPYSKNFDHELFPGLSESDVENVETWAESNAYRHFSFANPSNTADQSLSAFGRIEVIVNIINRLLSGGVPWEEITGVFFTNQAGHQEVDPEALRKYIKGVVKMQREIVAEATKLSDEIAAKLNQLKKSSYTVEEIEALHQEVLNLRAKLIALLEEKANKHEKRDVIEVENEVSLIFQEKVFDLFVSIVGAADVVVSIDGQTVVIPAKAITDALIAYLKQQFGDSIAAHHFARLYGISVDDIRRVHKLENYLSEQMVVLPRNSEFVEIVSQLSEIGYIQLAVTLVKRYASEVIKDGHVDVARLVELVSDKEKAVQWIKGEAQNLYSQTIASLDELMNSDFTLERLLELSKLMQDFKVGLVSMMNDFLSGQDDVALKTDLETFINSLYTSAKEARDNYLENKPFKVVIDGQKVYFHINRETVGGFIQFIERYLLEHPTLTQVSEIVYPQDKFDIIRPVIMDIGSVAIYDATPIYNFGIPIWNPVPRPDFDLNHHPTQFGMAVLFARLVVKYGEFVFSKNSDGQYEFSMDLFVQELQKTDQDRAERRLQAILDKQLPEVTAFIDSLRDSDGALPIDKLDVINRRFVEIRERILALSKDASNKAQTVWAEFIKVYEQNLFEGVLSMQVDGTRVTFEPKVLDEILMRLFNEKKLDPDLMKKFDDMISKGETTWQYNDFKYLRTFYDWIYYRDFDGGLLGLTFTETSDEDPDLSSAAGTFTLGDLLRLPGINRKDLSGGLDVAEKDSKLIITPIDPIKLLGLLDMRSIAPGSGMQVGGLMTRAFSVMAEVSYVYLLDKGLSWKSIRFKAFELIPAIAKELGIENIVTDGKIDAVKFELGLQGKLESYQKVIALAVSDLVTTFGFSKEMLDEALLKGLVKIDVDLKNLTATVFIDSSVRLEARPDLVYLADLLGRHRLPLEIHYTLGKSEGIRIMAPCIISADGALDCPLPQPPTYYLKSGSFQIGADHFAKLTYLDDGYLDDVEIMPIDFVGDNRLRFVRIYNGNPYLVCITTPCPTGVLIKAIQYTYTNDPSFFQASIYYYDPAYYRDGVYDGSVLFDGTPRPINVRENIEIKKMIDGKYHIMSIWDYFPNIGGLVAKNEFVYAIAIHPPCDPVTGCEPDTVTLMQINRTDANGNPLSKIVDIRPVLMVDIFPAPPQAYQATIVLANGKETQVMFTTIEDLLDQVLKIENSQVSVIPFEVSASTSTDGSRNLIVKVDEFGNAVASWNNQTYKGTFDPNTKQIIVPVWPKYDRIPLLELSAETTSEASRLSRPIYWPPTTQTWVLQLKGADNVYSIQSFEINNQGWGNKSVSTYYFNFEGLMETQSWTSESGSHKSGRKISYTYVKINDKILVESIISKYYSNGYRLYELVETQEQITTVAELSLPYGPSYLSESYSKSYYAYDDLGNQIAVVTVGSSTTSDYQNTNSRMTHWGSYTLTEGNKRTEVYVNNAPQRLVDLVNSANDYKVIDRFARLKTEYYFSGNPLTWEGLKFSIEYVKNKLGKFIPRYAIPNDSSNKSYIVRGMPDVLSGETNDILIKRWQEVDGYQITYGEAYQYNYLMRSVRNQVSVSSLSLAEGTVSTTESLRVYPSYQEPKYLGYGLVFSKWGQKPDGTWGQTVVVVDFPKVKKVELDGKLYHIKIDVEGNVNLIEIRPEPKIRPVPEPTVLRINNKVETILPLLITPKKAEPVKPALKLNLPKKKK